MLETLLALGHPPVAAAELELYARIVVEPPIPAGVADLGLRGSLNFEQLLLSRPDLILSSPFAKWARPQLERIAPVLSLPIYVPGEPPYGKAEAATREVAARLGIAGAGERVVADAAAEIDRIRAALAGRERRPVFIVNVGDPRHVRSFGEDSMFGNVLSRLGFDNAWRRPTSYRATAPVGLEALAEVPEARIVVVGPVPPDARRVLPQSALWKALPAVAGGRATFLPPVDAFGALPAALRFARLFAASLEASSNG
ncbi:iron complex transport system substrate-binding protein [Faunimonas pinastri]|uniref:Iron complex transport system substrate-binding protein n=2 Tax=Faunimonas pinastri TaxID=1855383 RepID=A0A1H9K3B7_9HYPH|nr:iron complex transport system substrate-binding protein [Faunimonas pinastri]